MRVIFLDFDGVLNADTDDVEEADELWTEAWLDPTLVARLAQLVEATSAVVVISSSWRQRRTQAELAHFLALRGYAGGVLDVTPRLPRPEEGERLVRAAEVRAWLDAQADIDSFVILDDDEDFGPLSARHVRIDSKVGLTSADVRAAMAILEIPLPTSVR